MRPRKPLLVWAAKPDPALDLAYVLRIQPWYSAEACWTGQGFEALLRRPGLPWELVILITNGQDGGPALATIAKSIAPYCPVLGISTKPAVFDLGPDVNQCIGANHDRSGLLGAIRVLSARKRGPRKGSTRKTTAEPERNEDPDGTQDKHRMD